MYKLADIPLYICGLVPTNLIFVARDYVHKRVSQLTSIVLEQLNTNFEALRTMATRALSDAATQYCEVVEVTALIRKYELQ